MTAMSTIVLCRGQVPVANNLVADASNNVIQSKGKYSLRQGQAQIYASGKGMTGMHIARAPPIRFEQYLPGRSEGQKRFSRKMDIKETTFLSGSPLSAQLQAQVLLYKQRRKTRQFCSLVPLNVSFLDKNSGASHTINQLDQYLGKVTNNSSSLNSLDPLQVSVSRLSKLTALVMQKPSDISGTAVADLSAYAKDLQGQSSESVAKFNILKTLEPLQGGLDKLSQTMALVVDKTSEASSSGLSTLPTYVKGLQGQADQLNNHLNSYKASLAPLQDALANLNQSLATLFEKASKVSTSALSNSHIPAQNVQTSDQPHTTLWEAANSVGASPGLERLGLSVAGVLHNAGVLISEVGTKIGHLPTGVHVDTSAVSSSVVHMFSQIGDTLATYSGVHAPPMATSAVLATIATSTVVVSSFNYADNKKGFVEGQDLPLRYDADTIGAYFRRRPLDIFSRSIRILFSCSNLTINILFDKYVGRDQEMERLRATQMVELIARLGPTAIKIGQALSIRPDILPVVYLEELQKLQDRVPPFPTQEAKRLIFEGLGRPAEEIFSETSPEPIAAASLGQVYKARLRETGELVAVKVQRPGVLEGISRDLFLLRQGARAFQVVPSVQSDLVGLIDTWAIRFFDELDYVQEAENAIRFSEDMRLLPNVTVPGVYLSYTSRKVLTSAWVNGEKLSESKATDLLPLISTALNCYLMQLLETGFLHADPHPGNLLRTPDGCLCVLDFGLMTEVTEDQRYTLIEYISHLVNSDYARVAEDLVRLGFVPPEFVDPEKTAAVVPQLSRVLGQLVQGGGARKVNIQQVTDDLANISKDYVFVIPPYFALILRAFSVLEGIGLDADPDYTIVEECYPYISKRLLTDDSPRTRAALQYFLYGGKSQLDPVRVEEITSGFQSFRELMAPANGVEGPPKLKPIDPTTKEALLLLLSPKGSFVQDLLLTELVRAVDALSRQALAELWGSFATAARLPLPPSLLTPGSWPLPLPGLVLGLSPTARLTDDDLNSLETVRRLWVLAEPQFNQRSSISEIYEVAQDVLPFLRELLPGVTASAQKFLTLLLQRQALRLAEDLDVVRKETPGHLDNSARAHSTSIQRLQVHSNQRLLLKDQKEQLELVKLEGSSSRSL